MNVPAPTNDYFIHETIAGLQMVAAIRVGQEPVPTGDWTIIPLDTEVAWFIRRPELLIVMSHPDPEMIDHFRSVSRTLGFQFGVPGLDFSYIYVEKPQSMIID